MHRTLRTALRFLITTTCVLAAALHSSIVITAAAAQSASGFITGVVRDASGAPIPGATVAVINERTGTNAPAVSNPEGVYRSAALAAGAYRVETALDGFQTAVQRVTLDLGQTATLDVTLTPSQLTEAVIVTARRTEEAAQEVPIPVSVIDGNLVANSGDFNVNRLEEMIPTVQFYSTNPRNSAINIRGLGAPFGLTNDGIEPGVGLYIDGVFYARPAAATLDFLDVERIAGALRPDGCPGDHGGRRSHTPADRRLHAGGRGSGADVEGAEPAVSADRAGPGVHATELQRVRSRDGRGLAAAVVSGPRRLVAQCRLEGRQGPRDVDDRVALLELESVERSRLQTAGPLVSR